MTFTIKYGIDTELYDVTEIAMQSCVKNNILFIPLDDHCRAAIFSDPIFGVLKQIFITNNKNGETYVCEESYDIFIDMTNDKVYTTDIPDEIRNRYEK
jgi:hypothetical protein